MKVSRETREWIVASAVVAIAIALAALGIWVFHSPADPRRSIGNVIFSDRVTLGFVRLLVVAAALYSLASIAVLVMRGRWLRSISTTGIQAETSSDIALRQLEERVRRELIGVDEVERLLRKRFDG